MVEQWGKITFGVIYIFLCNRAHQKRTRRKQWKNEGENKFECMIRCIQPDAVMILHPQPVGAMHSLGIHCM